MNFQRIVFFSILPWPSQFLNCDLLLDFLVESKIVTWRIDFRETRTLRIGPRDKGRCLSSENLHRTHCCVRKHRIRDPRSDSPSATGSWNREWLPRDWRPSTVWTMAEFRTKRQSDRTCKIVKVSSGRTVKTHIAVDQPLKSNIFNEYLGVQFNHKHSNSFYKIKRPKTDDDYANPQFLTNRNTYRISRTIPFGFRTGPDKSISISEN